MKTDRGAAVMPEKSASRSESRQIPFWALVLPPLLLLAGVLALILRTGPADSLKPAGMPPVEQLVISRVSLGPQGMTAVVLNDGVDPVTIAQVQVDDAYWQFSASDGLRLRHLGSTTLTIPYPWVAGEAHLLKVVTSTGTTFDREIAVAVETPRPGLGYFATFALIGLYVGVIPVAIGLMWFPMMSRLGQTGLEFVLALTVGLLLFLGVDATAEGLEVVELLPNSYQGTALLFFSAAAAYLSLAALGRWLKDRQPGAGASGGVLALLIAIGIGLHNLGEGLAIGAAFVLGEIALGSLLIIGFALHNTTEGLAIVAPLARQSGAARRVPLSTLVKLGLIGGVPTIAGAWLGGFAYSPVWALVCLGLGIGAIVQVVAQILKQMAAGEPLGTYLAKGAVVAGLFAGFIVMYATGLLVG